MPDFVEHIEGMAKILQEHNAPPEFIAMFKSNPVHVIPDAGHLVQLAARAKERKLTAVKEAEIIDLKKQLEAAKKGTTRMASSIKDAAAAGPSITSTTVKTGKSKAEATPDFSTMKTEDLKKWIESHKDVDG
jgi:seryl-tRNA synthetase